MLLAASSATLPLLKSHFFLHPSSTRPLAPATSLLAFPPYKQHTATVTAAQAPYHPSKPHSLSQKQASHSPVSRPCALHQTHPLLPRPSPRAPVPSHSMHSTTGCPAYVGEDAPPAGEYHCNDFDWEEHKRDVLAKLAPQEALLSDKLKADAINQEPEPDAGRHPAGTTAASGNSQIKAQETQTHSHLARSTTGSRTETALGERHEALAISHAVITAAANTEAAGPWQYNSSVWESFHARDNATARFYKERRYLLLEFPVLMVQQPAQHFLEIGCGCGSSLLPVLKANPSCRVTGTDLSPTAVHMFEQAAVKAGIAADRVTAFPADSTQPEALIGQLTGGGADAVLLIFTLAALAPQHMPAMLQAAYQALKPGGLLLIRDHGLYDLTHLRLRPHQQLGERLYRRLDGTMCYFFTTEDLKAKAEAAGFCTRECTYACVNLTNRKTGLQMKRVFVHGVFKRSCT